MVLKHPVSAVAHIAYCIYLTELPLHCFLSLFFSAIVKEFLPLQNLFVYVSGVVAQNECLRYLIHVLTQ